MSSKPCSLVAWALALLGLTCASTNAAIVMTLLTSVDLYSTSNSLNPEFIGNRPISVAWNGSTAWVGGYNTSGVTANTAIVPITDVLASPALGTAFGQVSTGQYRGIYGLAVKGNNLAASFDNGAGSGDSVRLFDALSGSLTWRIGDPTAGNDSSRRGSAVDFDPGFNGASAHQGVAYLAYGSGRRHLLNTATGVYFDGQNAGPVINFSPISTAWRDVAFDPATGDLYARENNRLGKATRSADNLFAGNASTVLPTGLATQSNIDTQNLEFVDNPQSGNFIILNDRNSLAAGQSFFNVVKAFDTAGTAQSITWDPAFAPGTGLAAYDFSYDTATRTLAVLDYSYRQLYVFGVNIPEPNSLSLIGVVALLPLRRNRKYRRLGVVVSTPSPTRV